MKWFLITTGAVVTLSFSSRPEINCASFSGYADTSHIIHILDGSTVEWPDTIFQTDKETLIHYAVDNDAQHLFLALRIADFRTQMKLMRQGMNLYIDLKGKKKEGRGIEFPVKREGEEGFSGGGFNSQQRNQQDQGGNGQRGSFDKKAIRGSMALHMFAMKLFGFKDGEPTSQGLQIEGTANIAFSWDSSDVMHIEYFIPINLLGDASSLKEKMISIGWKINGVDLPSGNSAGFSNSGGGGRQSRGGGGGFSGRSGGGSAPSREDMEKMAREQSFWTKYIFKM